MYKTSGAFLICLTVLFTLHPARAMPPMPAGASPELQKAISSFSAQNINDVRKLTSPNWEEIRTQTLSETPSISDLEGIYGIKITELSIAGVGVFKITPSNRNVALARSIFLHIHGGAYVFYGGSAGLLEAAIIAHTSGIEVLSVDYRMPPAHPFPAALDDVAKVYRSLRNHSAYNAIAIGGSSAGGGLALSLTHFLKAQNAKLPDAIFAGTPWSDLTKTGDTLYTLEGIDAALVTYDGLLEAAARLYADGHDLRHPYISPVYGSFDGFPPTLLISGTRDLFLSDTVRTHQHLRDAGNYADLYVVEGMSHGDYIFFTDTPESAAIFRELKVFLEKSTTPGTE